MRRVWAIVVVGCVLLVACGGAAMVDPPVVVELSFDGGGDRYGCGIQRGADVSPPLDRAGTCLDPNSAD